MSRGYGAKTGRCPRAPGGQHREHVAAAAFDVLREPAMRQPHGLPTRRGQGEVAGNVALPLLTPGMKGPAVQFDRDPLLAKPRSSRYVRAPTRTERWRTAWRNPGTANTPV